MSNQAKRLSNCAAERLAQCRGGLAPPVGGELEVLAWRVLGYNFNTEAFALDYAKWAEDIEPVRYLVDRTQAIRLQAEVSALQQRLNIADQRVCDLEVGLGGMLFAFDDGVGRDWSAPLLDHARKLCKAVEFKSAPAVRGEEPQCLLCLDMKTVPAKGHGGWFTDCPDCCGEEG
ncbi:MAG: hypothetical protein WBZ57_12080 [Pseudomonas graminis]